MREYMQFYGISTPKVKVQKLHCSEKYMDFYGNNYKNLFLKYILV